MSPETPAPKRRTIVLGLVTGVFVLAGIALAAIVATIAQHRQEAKIPTVRVVELTEDVDDPAAWGKDFPVEYDSYRKTTEMAPTKHAGSKAVPHTPTAQDPRTFTSRSKVDADPRFKEIWAGYAFATDYRERRGHAYMLEDQLYTRRQIVAKQPGTCIHCHASTWKAYRKEGDGDLVKGFEKVNAMPYGEARKLFQHPLACIDCHDPGTMKLRVTKPAFLEGIKALKASQGVASYDPNTMASRQEMRTYVCAQCHVEYYFEGPHKRLTYPWSKGVDVDRIVAYYDEIGFKDWVHEGTGAPVLKAQHPEFEMWSQGVHARSGVACADCHMPYMRVGATKVSDHQVRSPLLDVNRACQSCHRWPEKELRARVEAIQDRHLKLREQAFDALVQLVRDVESARHAGRADSDLVTPRYLQRRAQFLFDFVEAENSVGFHAPQEAARILGESIDLSRQGQLALRDPAFKPTVPVVNVSTEPAPTAPAGTAR